jgi:predicted transposase YbfD/YdcC
VSAWATERGVVLGQVATADHSNEITAIPVLLQLLNVRGATVTIDAMSCQKAIAQQARKFISSLPANVKRLASAIRGHWGIENGLHWSLDVTFNEDQSRIRQGHAAENAALLRRLSLSILKQDTRYSDSLRCKRLRAGWETSALEHFVAIFAGN